MHAAHAPLSSRHSNVAPDSPALKVTVALEPGDRTGGAELIVVFGADVSTANERVAGEASVFPAPSVARTPTLWAPLPSAVVVHGLVQPAHEPASSWHWNVDPPSVAVNANVGVVSLVDPVGPEPIVVLGAVVSDAGVVSTVNARLAGVASTLAAASVARTETLCGPSARAVVVQGLAQLAHAPESSWHWNVDPPSLALNANVGVVSFVDPVGPDVIVVSGAVVSAGGAAAPTVTAFIAVAVSPSPSVTVTRTFLTPASWKVNDIVSPLPSGHWSPAAPSPPSSSQV